MPIASDNKHIRVEVLVENDLQVGSSSQSELEFQVPTRYYFNLTNGETMIRDQEGIEAITIQAAVISAMAAVEELRAQDPTNSDEWRGWRLEIVDASGQAVQIIPLETLPSH
jgi:hypothetical protein